MPVIYRIILKVKIDYILSAALLVPIVLLLKTVRWQNLLRIQGIRIRLKDAYVIYLASTYIGIITPGRMGDLTKVFYLKKDFPISGGKAFSSVLLDKLFDLFSLLLFVFTGLIVLSPSKYIIIGIIATIAAFILLICFLLNDYSVKLLHKLSGLFSFTGKYYIAIISNLVSFRNELALLLSSSIPLSVLLSLGAYCLIFFQAYCITLSMSINISYFCLCFYISICNVVSLIPVSISGIGTRDIILINFFSTLSLTKETAISFSLLFFFVVFIIPATAGLIAWIKRPIPVNELKGQNK